MAAAAPPWGWSGVGALPSPHGAAFADEALGGGALCASSPPLFEFEDMVFGLLLPPADRDGGGAGAGAGGDAAGTAARILPLRDVATETQRGRADGDAWRCLLPMHTAECSRCSRPPPAAEEAVWLLKGSSKGNRSGEKQLRALLAHTREWASALARTAAAEQAAASGDDVLADALRCRDLSALRKGHMMALCALWRYRSDIWSRRTSDKPQRAKPRRKCSAPRLALALPPLPAPSAALSTLSARMLSYVGAYMHATQDAAVHAAARHEPLAPMTSWRAEMFALIIPPYAEFHAATAVDAAALRRSLGGIDGTAGAGSSPYSWGGAGASAAEAAPWWLRDSREALVTRADAHLLLISRMLHAHGAGTAALAGGAVSAPDRAAAAAWRSSNDVVATFIADGQSALLQARLAGRIEEHVAIAAEVMGTLAAIVLHSVVVMQRRHDWVFARAGASCGGGAFWRTFMAVAAGEAVPSARGAHPRIASLLETAVHAVLAGATA